MELGKEGGHTFPIRINNSNKKHANNNMHNLDQRYKTKQDGHAIIVLSMFKKKIDVTETHKREKGGYPDQTEQPPVTSGFFLASFTF